MIPERNKEVMRRHERPCQPGESWLFLVNIQHRIKTNINFRHFSYLSGSGVIVFEFNVFNALWRKGKEMP